MPRPTIVIPDDSTLEFRLGVNYDLSARVAYVRGLLRQVADVDRAFDAFETESRRTTEREEGFKTELRTLREKLGQLTPGERAARERAYAHRAQLDKAAGVLQHLVNEENRRHTESMKLIKQAQDAVKKPK